MKKRIALLFVLVLLLGACASRSPSVREVKPVEAQPEPAFRQSGYPGAGGAPEALKELPPAATPMPSDGAVAGTPAQSRLVIKTADLSLVVLDPVQSMDEIARMAESMGGFVVSSNVHRQTLSDGTSVPQAYITVRVPAERFQEALDQIKAGAGEVKSENIQGQDVTQEYTDLKSRLRNLEAAEQQLQDIMDQAYKVDDVLRVYNQLVQVREQIEVIKGQMQYYEQSAAFSAISVELIANRAEQPIQIGGWQPVGVAKDAIQSLIRAYQKLTERVIWLVLYVLPVSLPYLLVLWLVYRWGRRVYWRRKEKQASAVVTSESE